MQDGASDGEIPKFDGAGYDKDLVEALERDIVSRNPSIHWWASWITVEKKTHHKGGVLWLSSPPQSPDDAFICNGRSVSLWPRMLYTLTCRHADSLLAP